MPQISIRLEDVDIALATGKPLDLPGGIGRIYVGWSRSAGDLLFGVDEEPHPSISWLKDHYLVDLQRSDTLVNLGGCDHDGGISISGETLKECDPKRTFIIFRDDPIPSPTSES